MQPYAFEIDTTPEAAFAALHSLPGSLWLDSADKNHARGKYSFIAFEPVEIFQGTDAFEKAKERLASYKAAPLSGLPPFQGGVAGYVGYDMRERYIGVYDKVLAFDHAQAKAWLIVRAKTWEMGCEIKEKLTNLLSSHLSPPTSFSSPAWHPALPKAEYLSRIQKIIDYIRAGDIFQANLSQRFSADLPREFNPFAHYMNLRAVNPAPYAAYMNAVDVKISSASPEQFLKVSGRLVETRPIKGTAPLSTDPEILITSKKDRAENIMIVDLMRNDLSKVCEAYSITVKSLCDLESFASVHHLVSTVTGKLQDEKTSLDLLQACFPGGSITGAPKIRAMEIIDELEENTRGPYCGSIFYMGFDGAMDSNILIRTLVYKDNTVSLNSGGGITADSIPEQEYQETMNKAEAMFASFLLRERAKAA